MGIWLSKGNLENLSSSLITFSSSVAILLQHLKTNSQFVMVYKTNGTFTSARHITRYQYVYMLWFSMLWFSVLPTFSEIMIIQYYSFWFIINFRVFLYLYALILICHRFYNLFIKNRSNCVTYVCVLNLIFVSWIKSYWLASLVQD